MSQTVQFLSRSARSDRYRDGVRPAHAVGRPARHDGGGGRPRLVQGERGDDPHAVARVVGDRGVADPVVRPVALVLRDPGQEPVLPARPSVSRGRPADVGRAAVEEAPRLEGGDDRRPRCERVGLDLRLVLARGVRVRVGADLRQRDGCRRRSHQQHENYRDQSRQTAGRRCDPTVLKSAHSEARLQTRRTAIGGISALGLRLRDRGRAAFAGGSCAGAGAAEGDPSPYPRR